MTLQEARQQVDACELQITTAYSDLKSAVRDMGSACDSAEWDAELQIRRASQRETSRRVIKDLMISVLMVLFGFILSFAVPLLGGVLIFVGIFGVYIAFQSGPFGANKEIEEANGAKNGFYSRESSLNSILDDNI